MEVDDNDSPGLWFDAEPKVCLVSKLFVEFGLSIGIAVLSLALPLRIPGVFSPGGCGGTMPVRSFPGVLLFGFDSSIVGIFFSDLFSVEYRRCTGVIAGRESVDELVATLIVELESLS